MQMDLVQLSVLSRDLWKEDKTFFTVNGYEFSHLC